MIKKKTYFLQIFDINYVSAILKPFYAMFGELFLGENTNYYFTGTGRILSTAETYLRPSEATTSGLISLNQIEVFNLTLLFLKLVKVFV